MATFYHIGRIILCLALTFQGFYILGLIPGQPNAAFVSTMKKGLNNFQSLTHIRSPIFKTIESNITYVVYAIGGLLSLAFVNIPSTSTFVLKLNIVGLLILTFFIGIPYNVINGKTSPLDSSDKGLFHFYSNIAILGGLIYYHSATTPQRSSGLKQD